MEICHSNTSSSRIRHLSRDYTLLPDGRLYSDTKRRFLKPHSNGKGYLYYTVGKSDRFYVHRLVAKAWLPNPDNLPDVNHINEDKADNHVSNLEWCSRKNNMNHSREKIFAQHWQRMGVNQQTWLGQSNSSRTIIGLTSERNKSGNYKVLVRCHCGNELKMYYNDFLKDRARSCIKCRGKP